MQTNKVPPPFSCSYTPNIPELLSQLNCTIAISTFQAGKIIFISPKNDLELVQLPRSFNRPMGIAMGQSELAVSTFHEVLYYRSSQDLALSYPDNPGVYDEMWIPRARYHTGPIDIHDLHFGADKLYAVNTSFSCLCTIGPKYSFEPIWQPSFITDLTSEDRCHLNGLAMDANGRPAFLTALGRSNTAQGWRENITAGGILIDYESKEVVLEGLAMPHTPRIYDGKLYVLLSAEEKLVCVDTAAGTYEDVCHIGGFVRGMARHQDHLFVATSRLRKNSSTFRHLNIADKADKAKISVIHLPTGAMVGSLVYHNSVDEI